jgi:hypothetical protein
LCYFRFAKAKAWHRPRSLGRTLGGLGYQTIFVVMTEIFLLLEDSGTHRSFHRNSTPQSAATTPPLFEL